MKKIVLTFGLISGVISALMMTMTASFLGRVSYDEAELLGYTGIVLSALVIFFGIRSYRENVGGGKIGFGRGLAIGLLITAISALCYTAAFQVVYFKLQTDFGERFVACMIDKARHSGASAAEMEKVTAQAHMFKGLMDRPWTNAAFTFVEPLPVGVIVSLLAAGLLRKRG
jgi:uncharacterized protein DUF4199